MRFLVDMNLSPVWGKVLTDAGYPSIHWSDVGVQDAPDTEILAYAAAGGFIVFTNDLDFGAILAATGLNSPSVVQLRERDLSPVALGPQLLAAIATYRAELEEGALVTFDLKRAKARILPIRRERLLR